MTYSAYVQQVDYRDDRANSNKFYRAYVMQADDGSDFRVLFNWGRQGAKGQFQVLTVPSEHAAVNAADGKINDKIRKGYDGLTRRELRVVPDDLLAAAGVNENARSQAAAAISKDPFARLGADTDRLIRLVTGPAEVQAEAITLRKDLDQQLSALKASLTQAEGSLELVDDVMAMKLGA